MKDGSARRGKTPKAIQEEMNKCKTPEPELPKPKQKKASKKGVTFDDMSSSDEENTEVTEKSPAPPSPPATPPPGQEPEEPEEMPFRCKTCGDGFKMPRLLRKHETGKHPDKPVTNVTELERQMKRWCNLRAKRAASQESQ